MDNLFTNIPNQIPTEVIENLLDADNVRIERIISQGHASPADFWYDQDDHEWVIVLKGEATLQFEDETLQMNPGDYVLIPAHRRHRVARTTPDEPTVWLAVHFRSAEAAPKIGSNAS